jgi:hypothetical protein
MSLALFLACRGGHVEVVKELVKAGCYLYYRDNNGLTARQMIQRRMQQVGLYGSGVNWITGRQADAAILLLLNPQVQANMMQSSMRVERNYEIMKIHSLIQSSRADIKFSDGNTVSVPAFLQLPNVQLKKTANRRVPPGLPSSQDPRLSISTNQCSYLSTQFLIRTMLLPAQLVRTITAFLPLPELWKRQLGTMRCWIKKEHPNNSIVYLLDVLDEILEAGEFLSACDTARIPAPSPHPTWCDWKRSIVQRASCSNSLPNSNVNNDTGNNNPAVVPASGISSLSHDNNTNHSTKLRRLRRQIGGYLPLLSQYQHQTNIVKVLKRKPYFMPNGIVYRLIHYANIASVGRQYCSTAPTEVRYTRRVVPPTRRGFTFSIYGQDHLDSARRVRPCHDVTFSLDLALQLFDFVIEVHSWYTEMDENRYTTVWDIDTDSDDDPHDHEVEGGVCDDDNDDDDDSYYNRDFASHSDDNDDDDDSDESDASSPSDASSSSSSSSS